MKSQYTIKEFVNLIGYIGILLLLISTFLFTNIIEKMDLEISEIDYEVRKFERGSLITIILQNYYSIQKTRRQLSVSDFEFSNYFKFEDKVQKKLKADIFDLSKRLIIEYAVLQAGYSGKDVELIRKEAENKAIEVLNSALNDSKKLDKLNRILDEYLFDFIDSFKKSQDNYLSNLDVKKELIEKRNNWKNIFLWFQVIGIILIAITGLIGKSSSRNS